MKPILEVNQITKTFGSLRAVNAVQFQVSPGEICGFIGPNGAGKTTTMRIIATLELPDEGDVLVDGYSVLGAAREVRHRLGFMPDAYGAYTNTTVLDYLDFYARAYGLNTRQRRARIAHLMDFTALHDMADKQMGALSKGMKQRLCLAKTLLNDPPLLVLDEPAAGLDPRARIELRELVKALAGMGKAVLISSHILSELSEMCDAVAVIERGSLQITGSIDTIVQGLAVRRPVFVRALAALDATEAALVEDPHVARTWREREGVVFEFVGGDDELARLLKSLVERGLCPIEFSPKQANLEDVFLSLTQGAVQ